jgi:hypothetical protein
LPLGVLDRDVQPTREQIFAIPTNRVIPAALQEMRIAPLGWPRHDDDARREARALASGSSEPLRHVCSSVSDARDVRGRTSARDHRFVIGLHNAAPTNRPPSIPGPKITVCPLSR